MRNLKYLALSIGLWMLIVYGINLMVADESKSYQAVMNEDSRVYDGDTIQDVFIAIKEFADVSADGEVLWPGILLKDDVLYIVTDIRLAGIDTPEKRPKKAGRTAESLAREKAAADAAQKALLKLVKDNNYEFTIRNPQLGKYSGRTVAEVWFGDINASEYMLQQGYAMRYDGGTKPKWNW